MHIKKVRCATPTSAADINRTPYFEFIIGSKKCSLKLHCGPGDTAVPVLTLMLPSED